MRSYLGLLNELRMLTKAKIKQAESANLKDIASNKLHCCLTVECSEMPASFYSQPLAAITHHNLTERRYPYEYSSMVFLDSLVGIDQHTSIACSIGKNQRTLLRFNPSYCCQLHESLCWDKWRRRFSLHQQRCKLDCGQ